MLFALIIFDSDELCVDSSNCAVDGREDNPASITYCYLFNTCSDERRFWHNGWSSLLLHVGTHERAVSIVMVKERDHGSGNRKCLIGSNVNIMNFISRHNLRTPFHSDFYIVWYQSIVLHQSCSMSNVEILFFKSV